MSAEITEINTTVKEYDLSKNNEQLQQYFITLGLMIFMHFQWGYLRPLIIQSLLGLRTLYSVPLFQVYILDKKAADDLKRPWKTRLFDLAKPTEQKTAKEMKAQEKKAIKKLLKKH
ncbi:hypothetical protein HK405_010833 [Cladochytrium tenue]|nr:hypothetical protein HK405_010833 [Cladochytrium tenue]